MRDKYQPSFWWNDIKEGTPDYGKRALVLFELPGGEHFVQVATLHHSDITGHHFANCDGQMFSNGKADLWVYETEFLPAKVEPETQGVAMAVLAVEAKAEPEPSAQGLMETAVQSMGF